MKTIQISNLNFSYGTQIVLENVNLSYDSRDFLAIIGPNGGGKSTLLRLMLGLLRPDSGQVLLFGESPCRVSRLIGYVPQNFLSNPSFPMCVIEVVLMGLIERKKFGFYSRAQRALAMEALAQVGMADFAQARIGELSGGQRQRVYIARALCSQAKILMLDEPTASIDTKGQAEIYAILREINARGTGVVLVSHDLNIALNFATQVAYVSRTLHLHDISPDLTKRDFITHLAHEHNHFCDVEIALGECEHTNFGTNLADKQNLGGQNLKVKSWRASQNGANLAKVSVNLNKPQACILDTQAKSDTKNVAQTSGYSDLAAASTSNASNRRNFSAHKSEFSRQNDNGDRDLFNASWQKLGLNFTNSRQLNFQNFQANPHVLKAPNLAGQKRETIKLKSARHEQNPAQKGSQNE